MDKAILYIHGKGGNPKEAEYYKALFEEYDVIGFDYSSQSPWEAKKEFPRLFDNLCGTYETVTVIANSIGAFFAMSALADSKIEKAYFISPVVDIERFAEEKIMGWAGKKKRIVVGRHMEGITLNPLEWLLSNDGAEIMTFNSVDEAKGFLKGKGYQEEDMEFLRFVEEWM